MSEKKLFTASNLIVQFLEDINVSAVFCVSGGSIHNIIAAIDSSDKIKLIPCYHEQGAVFAAEAYARETKNLGVVLVTSGPGLTNIVTGISSCWVDSIPLLVLAGQVLSSQRISELDIPIRQRGVQESPTHDLVRSNAKSSYSISKSCDLLYYLQIASRDAQAARQGPVILEMPVDTTYMAIPLDRKNYSCFLHNNFQSNIAKTLPDPKNELLIDRLIGCLSQSRLPLVLLGNGIRSLSQQSVNALIDFCVKNSIFYSYTWAVKDIIEPISHTTLCIGSPGIFGSRSANACLRLSDFVLVLGSSFSYTHSGYRLSKLNMDKFHIVDIDSSQLAKPELNQSNKYVADLRVFLPQLLDRIPYDFKLFHNDSSEFSSHLKTFEEHDFNHNDNSNIYLIAQSLNKYLSLTKDNITVVTDMGTSFTAFHSFLRLQGGRMFTASGHAPMGWGLPGAVGAIAAPNKNYMCDWGWWLINECPGANAALIIN